jgi:hypothetical protein
MAIASLDKRATDLSPIFSQRYGWGHISLVRQTSQVESGLLRGTYRIKRGALGMIQTMLRTVPGRVPFHTIKESDPVHSAQEDPVFNHTFATMRHHRFAVILRAQRRRQRLIFLKGLEWTSLWRNSGFHHPI